MWCAKWRIKLNPEKKPGDSIVQVHARQKNRTQLKTVQRDSKSVSSYEISRNYFRLPTHCQVFRGHPGPLQYQVPPFKATSQQKMGTYNPPQNNCNKTPPPSCNVGFLG